MVSLLLCYLCLVGLKMNLLDPTLSIDLQYLGVRLPIPPPGTRLQPLSQELPPSQGELLRPDLLRRAASLMDVLTSRTQKSSARRYLRPQHYGRLRITAEF